MYVLYQRLLASFIEIQERLCFLPPKGKPEYQKR